MAERVDDGGEACDVEDAVGDVDAVAECRRRLPPHQPAAVQVVAAPRPLQLLRHSVLTHPEEVCDVARHRSAEDTRRRRFLNRIIGKLLDLLLYPDNRDNLQIRFTG